MQSPITHLTNAHYQHLKASAISDDIIKERQYRSFASGKELALADIGYDDLWSKPTLKQILPGLLLPVYPVGEPPSHCVIKPDAPRVFSNGRSPKYEHPQKTPLVLDILPRYRSLLSDTTIPLWITEGAKKADALASALDMAVVPASINGVYGWSAGGILQDFDVLALRGRPLLHGRLRTRTGTQRQPSETVDATTMGGLVGLSGGREQEVAIPLRERGYRKDCRSTQPWMQGDQSEGSHDGRVDSGRRRMRRTSVCRTTMGWTHRSRAPRTGLAELLMLVVVSGRLEETMYDTEHGDSNRKVETQHHPSTKPGPPVWSAPEGLTLIGRRAVEIGCARYGHDAVVLQWVECHLNFAPAGC